MATQTPTSPEVVDRATVTADLAFTRERLRELAQKYPKTDTAVRAAIETAERAKLAADLRPDDRQARAQAEHEERKLDTAILERDAVSESIERLRNHEGQLAAKLAAFATADHSAAQAAFREDLAAGIRSGSAEVRRWVGMILLDSELVGRRPGDVGLLISEYLSGEFRHSALTADRSGERKAWGEANRMRAAYERGEKLP